MPYMKIETEPGNIPIYIYIHKINIDGFHKSDFELYNAYDLYNINIAECKAILNSKENLINLSFVKCFNDDNNERKYIYYY